MNDCDRWQELLALRLYGELDEPERAHLDEHLTHCDACRARERELAEGLGRLRHTAPHDADDALARERLRRALAREIRPGARSLAPALVGFAAGALCALGLVAAVREGAPTAPSGTELPGAVHIVPDTPTFARATPPPSADDRGLGATLAALSRR